MQKIHKTEEEWKKILTPEQYKVMREKETERPFTCELKEFKGEGVYHCAACDLPLFKSGSKFESSTGWPSFYEPFAPENLIFKSDDSLEMERTEVLCVRCESHLGHVFDDGPPPSGKRFCINGLALKFKTTNERSWFASN